VAWSAADERLLLLDVPAPHLDLLDLLGGGDNGAEAQKVRSQGELKGVFGLQGTAGRRPGRVSRLVEVELAVDRAHLVATLVGEALQEIPVAHVALRAVRGNLRP